MKDHFKKLLLLVTLALLLFVSCSKTEDAPKTPIAITGGEVFRSQVVTINLPDTDLPENEYQATLGGIAVTLSKADEHKLLFGLPATSALGLKDLIIPTLGNLTIRYDVKDTVLSETAEATMQPFKTNLTTYSQSLDNSANSIAIQNSITSFNAVYANLTPAEKTEMAIIYKANASLINDILAGNFSRFDNRSSPNQNVITLFVLHKLAVLGIAAGAVLFELGTHPGVKALGAVLAGVSTGFAVEHFGNIIINRCVALGAVFDGIMGVNNRNSNTLASASIAFQSDEAKIINFNTNNRTLVSNDSNKTQSELVSFFKYNTKYNQIISNINNEITWVNNNVIFANFSLLPVEVMPASSAEANTAVNQAVFSNIQLSISDPNLTLVSSSLQSDGKLNLKIKIIGTPTTLPIESFLNYSYSDEFNTFSGKLPIKVAIPSPCDDTTTPYPTVTIGSQVWMQKNLNVCKYRNGDDIPEVQDPTAWAALTTGAWCYYENNTANGPVYGKLYNWYAVNDPRGLAPIGYHVFSVAEWNTLITFLGGSGVAGGKMKAMSPLWGGINTGATNSSGFTGLPGGFRGDYPAGNVINYAEFRNKGEFGMWWSSSEAQYDTPSIVAYNFSLGYNMSYVSSLDHYERKFYGMSVRCIKD